ncbi:hypothetical protein MCHI_002170, partial [Candidatus Magnetoovum chiemensis]
MILDGRVTVNGKVAIAGTVADIEKDHIKIDGKRIHGKTSDTLIDIAPAFDPYLPIKCRIFLIIP